MFRCYNGAWDSAALALFAEQDRLMDLIRVHEPNAHCTYFPAEGEHQVHVWGRALGPQRGSKLAALREALSNLSPAPL